MPAPSSFVVGVRHALAHLYDPDILRDHPLLLAFGLSYHPNPQSALRDRLIRGIEAVKPAPSVPVDSRAWRIYRVLLCHYVQQLDQEQTAHQLGVGVRHLRREQRVAVEVLADLLYQDLPSAESTPAPESGVAAAAPPTHLEDEIGWLRERSESATNVTEILQAALGLVSPLAATQGTRLDLAPFPTLGPVALHPAALRQAAVSAASCAIRRTPAGMVRLAAERWENQVRVTVTGFGRERLGAGSAELTASLGAARALLTMAGGNLEASEDETTLTLTLVVPVAATVEVLLVDDNSDFAQLFSRYVSGTRYRVHHAPGAEQLSAAVTEVRPDIIVLDVMIPGIDGWEILGRLRQHPLTSDLPIIICTVLPEREVALALGASVFLAKPVMREALLAALDQATRGPR